MQHYIYILNLYIVILVALYNKAPFVNMQVDALLTNTN